MKKIIVMNLGWEQETLLDRLDAYGLDMYGVHYNDDYYKKPRYKDMLITDLRDLKKICQFAARVRPDAVISDQCDYSGFAQSILAERYALPGPRVKEAQVATNKYLQRTTAKEGGVTVPAFALCLAMDDVRRFVAQAGLPVVIKPVDNRGGFGVTKVEDEKGLEAAFYDALLNSHSRFVLAEKFIDGTHITVDGYMFRGKGPTALALATKKKLKDSKGGILDGEIVYPGDLEDGLYDRVMRNAEVVAGKLGFSFGFFHGEFIVGNDGGVYLTEMANRGGGVFTSEVIVPHVSGIDIVDVYIKDALGMPGRPGTVLVEKNPALMKFFSFYDLQGKVVKNIRGIREAEQVSSTLRLKLLIKKGDRIPQITCGPDRHGVIIVTAASKGDLPVNVQKSLDLVKVEYE